MLPGPPAYGFAFRAVLPIGMEPRKSGLHDSSQPGLVFLLAGYSLMSRRRQIYEGKAKILYEGPEPGTLIQYFKDDATAFNAQK